MIEFDPKHCCYLCGQPIREEWVKLRRGPPGKRVTAPVRLSSICTRCPCPGIEGQGPLARATGRVSPRTGEMTESFHWYRWGRF